MGYYIRVLSPSIQVPKLEHLTTSLASVGSVILSVESGKRDDWLQLVLAHADGTAIASIERDVVGPGLLGEAEIREFINSTSHAKPASAARWLKEYLAKVKCIYAFQILSGARKNGHGWSAVHAVQDAIHDMFGGINQADGEGFSNEDGFHILWQFSERVKGAWWMAVLRDGEWITFQMQLENLAHRRAFLRGEIPAGIVPARPGK